MGRGSCIYKILNLPLKKNSTRVSLLGRLTETSKIIDYDFKICLHYRYKQSSAIFSSM